MFTARPLGNFEREKGTPVTLMPLGDSITEGSNQFSVYRYPLMEKLKAASYNVEYIGSKTTFPKVNSPLGVLHHEGYAGQNIEFIESIFDSIFQKNPADMILLHAGHNHTVEEQPVAGIVAATRSIIEKARKINPHVTVLLAQVIPSGKLPKYSYIPELHQKLSALVAELDTPEQKIVLVDQAGGFNWQTDTVEDRVHPNEAGAKKMASKWFTALQAILPAPSSK